MQLLHRCTDVCTSLGIRLINDFVYDFLALSVYDVGVVGGSADIGTFSFFEEFSSEVLRFSAESDIMVL